MHQAASESEHWHDSGLKAGVSRRQQLIGILICAMVVAAFEYAAFTWSLAGFHPGGDSEVPSHVRDQAEIGTTLSQPFMVPLIWVMQIASPFPALVFQWVFLPLLY